MGCTACVRIGAAVCLAAPHSITGIWPGIIWEKHMRSVAAMCKVSECEWRCILGQGVCNVCVCADSRVPI